MARIALALSSLVLAHTALPAPALAAGDWAWPVRGEVLSPYRNGTDPYAGGQHRGIDIAARVGEAVRAPTGGRVTFVGTAGSSGLTVALRTADGRYDTSYLHLASASVRRGDEVVRGARLGAVGTSGRRSVRAPHLHFGVRRAGARHAYVDPLSLLSGPGGPADSPRPLPLPLGAPAPLRPGPAGARALPAPAGARALPAPAGAPALPRLAPALRPLPAALAPAGRRASSRSDSRAPAGASAGAPAPSGAGRGLALPGPASRPRRGGAPAAGRSPEPAARPARPPVVAGRAALPVGGDLDLGWLAACLGLAAAALGLGRSGTRRAVEEEGRRGDAGPARPAPGLTVRRRLAPLFGGR